MRKPGRPGISYNEFVQTWEQLIQENQASINEAQKILGGNKSTLSSFKEQYERERASKELSMIQSIELPDAVLQAISEIKVKEIEALKKIDTQQKTRIEEYLAVLKETEEKLASAKVDLDDAKFNFDAEKLSFECKLAAAQARIHDIIEREQKLTDRYEQLNTQYNQAKQEAAVAIKEAEMLREQRSISIEKKPNRTNHN